MDKQAISISLLENISWNDVQLFIKKLNEKENTKAAPATHTRRVGICRTRRKYITIYVEMMNHALTQQLFIYKQTLHKPANQIAKALLI